MFRNIMLKAAASPALVRVFSTLGKRSGLSSRFIAGESLDEALSAAGELNRQGIKVSLDLLGEGVVAEAEAERATLAYMETLDAIAKCGADSNISIKLTQLGLDISRDVCARNLKRLLTRAGERKNFVRIDMEGSDYTERTLDLFKEHLSIYGREHVGIVIQAYLNRSEQDIQELAKLGCNVRLCKGAYMEPPEVAFPEKEEVDRSFIRLLEMLLRSTAYTAIASHDEAMLNHARRFISEHQLDGGRYEFQMLYGIRRDFQLKLRDEGYRMRVYVPFGTQWAPYFMRRLAERPANILFIGKALFRS